MYCTGVPKPPIFAFFLCFFGVASKAWGAPQCPAFRSKLVWLSPLNKLLFGVHDELMDICNGSSPVLTAIA
jgi:hypothetical protein